MEKKLLSDAVHIVFECIIYVNQPVHISFQCAVISIHFDINMFLKSAPIFKVPSINE